MAILKFKDENGVVHEVPAIKGDRGEKGNKGDVGSTPILSIGTVTTLSPEEPATVTIEGTAEAPILNFGIPKGNIGITNLANFEDSNSSVEPIGDDSGDVEVVTSLPTDGLVAAFDFRNPNTTVDSSKGLTTFHPVIGSGCLFTWNASVLASYDDYGSKIGRPLYFSAEGNTTPTPFGEQYTWCFFGHGTAGNSIYYSNDHTVISNVYLCNLKPKYNTSSGVVSVTSEAYGSDENPGYHSVVFVVNGTEMSIYVDNILAKTYKGTDYEDFVSWYSIFNDTVSPNSEQTSRTYLAVYKKAMTADEVSTVNAYFESLEVV